MSTTKADYITKDGKNAFIKWFIDTYGYNINRTSYNSRILSEEYLKQTNILIPKITIHRWLKSLDKQDQETQVQDESKHKKTNLKATHEALETYCLNYISKELCQVS